MCVRSWEWSHRRNSGELGLRLAGEIFKFWDLHGHPDGEGAALAQEMLEREAMRAG